MKYPILIEKKTTTQTAEQYQVVVPDLPGCSNNATTINEAIEKIEVSIKEHLTILAEYSEAIPQANSIDFHFDENKNGIWAIIEIDITPYLGKSHKINVTLPELLIKQIDDRVNKSAEYKTRSGFIASACLIELTKTT